MKRADRLAAIERARCDRRPLREILTDARKREKRRRYGVAAKRRARMAHAEPFDDGKGISEQHSKDETTPYPHGPGYHLTVNGETTVYVDYSAAITAFVEVINGTLELQQPMDMDLVGEGLTMGFSYRRKG